LTDRTAAARQAKQRQRRKEAGEVLIQVWVPADKAEAVRAAIEAEVQEKILNHIVFKPLSWDPAHGYEMRRRPKKWKPPPERGRASGVPHRVDELE
jgi:hypothetical protein